MVAAVNLRDSLLKNDKCVECHRNLRIPLKATSSFEGQWRDRLKKIDKLPKKNLSNGALEDLTIESTKASGQTAMEHYLRLTSPRERSSLVGAVDGYMKTMCSPDHMDVRFIRCDGKDECTVCGAQAPRAKRRQTGRSRDTEGRAGQEHESQASFGTRVVGPQEKPGGGARARSQEEENRGRPPGGQSRSTPAK